MEVAAPLLRDHERRLAAVAGADHDCIFTFPGPAILDLGQVHGHAGKLPRLDRHDRYGADPRRERDVPRLQHPLIRTRT